MPTKQKAKGKRSKVKSCDKCVHKSICILYYGHGQLELRFGNSYVKDPEGFIGKLDERLAFKCLNYLETDSTPVE
jgi:hypothetical protein